MRCASCGFANPESAKFCQDCGQRLLLVCPSCGQQMNPTAKFCSECGTPVASSVKRRSKRGKPQRAQPSTRSTLEKGKMPSRPRVQSSAEISRAAEAERRQLTVMFCDLVGSTTLSTQLDPEELREIVRAYQASCAEVIQRYDGHIAQHLGDGLLVYFGYPAAHEDDAARAVRAGLRIIEAVHALKTRLTRPLQVRIGIHTGLVVVGEMGGGRRQEQLALGETPNLAARIQGQAEPDTVFLSAATYRLIEGLFDCEDRGQPELKGVATPLTLYRVAKEGEAQSRFQVVARKGFTPLVGRDHEHSLLRERWERVKDGAGQVVLLSGEPGIGKSRLVEVLKETATREGAHCLELRCSPYHQNSALQPVIEHLQRQLQLRVDDRPETNLEKLQQALGRSRFCQADTLPLLAALLSLPHPPDAPPLTLSPQKQKEKTYEAVVAWLCEEARQHAVTYAWEDLHWADPSTLDLLALFLEQVPTTRLLAVLTFRPEFTPSWGAHSYLSQITLSRLGRSQVETMVENVTGGKALPAEVVQQIVSKTDGVPLFVEELTKMVMESELVSEVEGHYELNGPLPPLAIPSTLQDSLMARLDRLATVREIAQMGATLGREFDYVLLQDVSPLHEDTLQQGLRQLVDAELVYQSGVPPQARYLFKHVLVQETAYQSLLKSRRQQLHQQVAWVLEKQFPATVESQPELVAHHYTEGWTALEEAMAIRPNHGDRYWEAELYRLKGELLLTQARCNPESQDQRPSTAIQAEVETCYQQAIETARELSAKSLELRAATSLARLWQQQGKKQEAHNVLAPVYHWFTEGFDTKDLQEAKALLEELS